MNNATKVVTLGKSPFNYSDYSPERFIHYYQQIMHVLRFAPNAMLEIGPGDHTVTDFLRRKGINVETYDNDEALSPTYLGDIRQPLLINKTYDLILASEVLEHMNIKWLSQTLSYIKKNMADDGILLVSIPYSTVRLFPPRNKYGKIISCEGRIHTYIPMHIFTSLTYPLRIFYRLVIKRQGFTKALEKLDVPHYPDDEFVAHQWDLALKPTTRKFVRKIFEEHFSVLEETIYVNTNCVFYALKRKT